MTVNLMNDHDFLYNLLRISAHLYRLIIVNVES